MYSDVLDTSHIVKLINLGLYKAPAVNMVQSQEIPSNTEYIELLTGGKIYFTVNGKEKIFTSGALFWHLPGEYTICKTDRESPYQCLVFGFQTSKPPKRQVPKLSFWENNEEIDCFAKEIHTAIHDNSCDRRFLCHYAYSKLLWKAYIYTREKADLSLPIPVRKLLDAFENILEENLSVEDLAEIAGISVPYLHTLCKKHLNMSPHHYLVVRRIQKSGRLLAGTDLQIKNISDKCGFMNAESFCRCFKKHYNMTPGQYRKKHSPYYILKQYS